MKFVGAIAIVVLGMAGLHFGIEYSGWVLSVGLLAVAAAICD